MPRRKQDCPKRMKWEEEAAARLAAGLSHQPECEEADGSPSEDEAYDKDGDGRNSRSSSRSYSMDDAPRDSADDDDQVLSPPPRKTSAMEENPTRERQLSPESSSTESPKMSTMGGTPSFGDMGMMSPTANIQALLASAVFSPLLSTGGAGLLLPGALQAMQGLPFVNPLLSLSPTAHPLSAKLPTNMSPPVASTPSPARPEGSIIDFSTKRKHERDSESPSEVKKSSATQDIPTGRIESPLDLSTVRKREKPGDASPTLSRKASRLDPSALWAAGLVPSGLLNLKTGENLWNGHGHLKTDTKNSQASPSSATVNDATRALERMTELSRFTDRPPTSSASAPPGAGSRQSAWQSHWLSKGAETAKDVLKCVWCKQSFDSLAALTAHMKESKHCGVNASLIHGSLSGASGQLNPAANSLAAMQNLTSQSHSSTRSSSSSASSSTDTPVPKETVQLPRKLVRGQDVWLGKGAEQTRQILKCMWCGQSFSSLAEMTTHMQQTQHYTNIISQEQIISWKASDDKTAAQNHVNAVLTCKVCDQAFSSLKELSTHMVKNSHYKEHIMRSLSESGGRRRQARDKRKKALPVRKLLELERAQQEARRDAVMNPGQPGRITCEKCGEKIETRIFVEHIRVCVGASKQSAKRASSPSHKDGGNGPQNSASRATPEGTATAKPEKRESPNSEMAEVAPRPEGSPSVLNAIEKLIEKSFDTHTKRGSLTAGTSILKRLGIDESIDYTKPLMDPTTVNMLRLYGYQRERSTSEASSASERATQADGHVNGDSQLRDSGKSTPSSVVMGSKIEPPQAGPFRVESEPIADLKIKREHDSDDSDRSTPTNFVEKDRVPKLEEQQVKQEAPEIASPCPSYTSERSLGSATPASSYERKVISPDEVRRSQSQTPDARSSSLNALSSMFEGLSSPAAPSSSSSSNPLAALQKLCDKTETTHSQRPSNSLATTTSSAAAGPGAILAFSWACNDAIMTDSIMKCAFCDTQFISKGAYRHHLSKMHFVKDPAPGSKGQSASSSKAPPAGPSPQPPATNFEESPHSKFLKYTELAKQLSSKYV